MEAMLNPETPDEQQPVFRFKRTQSADFQTVYANNAQIASTYFDVNIFFGELIAVEHHELLVKDRVLVRMSPEHARALYKALGQQLEQFENKYGPLRAEPTIP